jgi:hypothetical protein
MRIGVIIRHQAMIARAGWLEMRTGGRLRGQGFLGIRRAKEAVPSAASRRSSRSIPKSSSSQTDRNRPVRPKLFDIALAGAGTRLIGEG